MPEIVPATDLPCCLLQVSRGDDVVAIEHRTGFVPGNSHTHDFWNARPDEVSSSGSAQVMTQHAGESCRLARARPTFSKVSDTLSLEAAFREVGKEIGDNSLECPRQCTDSLDLFFYHLLYVG